jgi:hypothetical protein
MYHPESDSLFEVNSIGEYQRLFDTIDGQLCADVTDDPARWAQYRKENRKR